MTFFFFFYLCFLFSDTFFYFCGFSNKRRIWSLAFYRRKLQIKINKQRKKSISKYQLKKSPSLMITIIFFTVLLLSSGFSSAQQFYDQKIVTLEETSCSSSSTPSKFTSFAQGSCHRSPRSNTSNLFQFRCTPAANVIVYFFSPQDTTCSGHDLFTLRVTSLEFSSLEWFSFPYSFNSLHCSGNYRFYCGTEISRFSSANVTNSTSRDSNVFIIAWASSLVAVFVLIIGGNELRKWLATVPPSPTAPTTSETTTSPLDRGFVPIDYKVTTAVRAILRVPKFDRQSRVVVQRPVAPMITINFENINRNSDDAVVIMPSPVAFGNL
jgi:hypothetical protein